MSAGMCMQTSQGISSAVCRSFELCRFAHCGDQFRTRRRTHLAVRSEMPRFLPHGDGWHCNCVYLTDVVRVCATQIDLRCQPGARNPTHFWRRIMLTDTQLQHNVQAELEWEPSVDSTQIGVMVKDGVVTLTGYASAYSHKVIAERVAKQVFGVKAVANEIEIKIPGVSQRNDSDIAAAALNALKWDVSVPDDKIKVTVGQGHVTLEGNVEWQHQRAAAERHVRFLMGVRAVTNQITVRPKHAKPADVRQKIHAAFERSAHLDARRVGVEAMDGTITLRGNVRTWSERDEAEKAAWKAPGVSVVDNLLTVSP